jgi:hypothetical protein
MSVSIENARLTDLVHRYKTETRASLGYLKLKKSFMLDEIDDGISLSDFFRHYYEPVLDNEKKATLKKEIDALMRFYGLLEIASIIQYVPDELPEKLKEEILQILDHGAVRTFYMDDHPLMLVQYLYNRITSPKERENEYDAEIVFPLFYEFLSINNRLEQDEELQQFLELFIDENLQESLGLILDFIIQDFKGEKEPQPLGQSPRFHDVQGYFKFLDFITSLHNLLVKTEPLQEIHSAFFLYHASLFDRQEKNFNILSNMTSELINVVREECTNENSNFNSLLKEKDDFLSPQEIKFMSLSAEIGFADFKNGIAHLLKLSNILVRGPVLA